MVIMVLSMYLSLYLWITKALSVLKCVLCSVLVICQHMHLDTLLSTFSLTTDFLCQQRAVCLIFIHVPMCAFP